MSSAIHNTSTDSFSKMFLCVVLRRFSKHRQHLRRFASSYDNESLGQSTHFGYQSVPMHDKQTKVDAVFENVADTYDVMNDAMSIGIHRLWKDYFISQLDPTPGTKLLDVAGGTGDIAFRFLKQVANEIKFNRRSPAKSEEADKSSNDANSSSHVMVCDINQAMLDVGQERATKLSITSGISWMQGNAEELAIEDNSYDAYTIAYGIRNVTHIDKVLSEAYRVLRPGGRFMCLEFSQVPNPVLRKVYDEYSFQVIPVLGQLIAADWHSYQYLVESIRQFPPQDEFARMIKDVGFKMVNYENLTFGVTAIHSGFKL